MSFSMIYAWRGFRPTKPVRCLARSGSGALNHQDNRAAFLWMSILQAERRAQMQVVEAAIHNTLHALRAPHPITGRNPVHHAPMSLSQGKSKNLLRCPTSRPL